MQQILTHHSVLLRLNLSYLHNKNGASKMPHEMPCLPTLTSRNYLPSWSKTIHHTYLDRRFPEDDLIPDFPDNKKDSELKLWVFEQEIHRSICRCCVSIRRGRCVLSIVQTLSRVHDLVRTGLRQLIPLRLDPFLVPVLPWSRTLLVAHQSPRA